MKRAVAKIDLSAIEHNCALLAERARPRAELCAVVKANAYGHGMEPVAKAALRGGATVLAVATANEAAQLRGALPDARIFTMGSLSRSEAEIALGASAEIAVWREGFLEFLSTRARELGVRPRVHVKYDTGMGRLGEPDPDVVSALCDAVAADDALELTGVWTHFATADERGDDFFPRQLEAFTVLAERVRASHPGVTAHAANSAATLREPASHFDMVRCGIAIYGLDPFGVDPAEHGLRPALELRSRVADVKPFAKGTSAGYGRTWRAPRETNVGVVPIGYGDGWRRGLSNKADVLIGGRRYPIAGTISMDNLTVDLGPHTTVEPGDEVVLIGAQGEERQSAEDLARILETINYEITCGISQRVPREYVGGDRA